MRLILNCIILPALLISTGCATILRGTRQNIEFTTKPTGATVQIDDKTLISPCVLNLKRSQNYPVIVSRAGYCTMMFDLTPQWDGVSLVGNLILPGGSAGLIMDTADGADHNFFDMADIVMIPTTEPSEPHLRLNVFKGHLLTDPELAVAIRADRLDRSQFFRGEP